MTSRRSFFGLLAGAAGAAAVAKVAGPVAVEAAPIKPEYAIPIGTIMTFAADYVLPCNNYHTHNNLIAPESTIHVHSFTHALYDPGHTHSYRPLIYKIYDGKNWLLLDSHEGRALATKLGSYGYANTIIGHHGGLIA